MPLEPCTDKRILKGQLIVTALWIVITAIGIFLSPSPNGHGTHQQLGLPPCPSVLLFDKPCPGCGLTTSWTATIHGQLATAFTAHPLGPLLYLGLTFAAIMNLWAYFKGYRIDTSGRKWMFGIVTGAILFFGYGIGRFILSDTYRAPDELENYVRSFSPQPAKQ